MSPWARMLALVTVGSLVGCAGGRTASGASAHPVHAGGDTLQGTVMLVGAEPMTSVVIAGVHDTIHVRAEPAGLRAADGLVVTVAGRRAAPCGAALPDCRHRSIDVRSFRVRAAAGVEAIDGVVGVADGIYQLRLADGSAIPVPHLPLLLRNAVGARVYLAGPLDRAPDSYGILLPRP